MTNCVHNSLWLSAPFHCYHIISIIIFNGLTHCAFSVLFANAKSNIRLRRNLTNTLLMVLRWKQIPSCCKTFSTIQPSFIHPSIHSTIYQIRLSCLFQNVCQGSRMNRGGVFLVPKQVKCFIAAPRLVVLTQENCKQTTKPNEKDLSYGARRMRSDLVQSPKCFPTMSHIIIIIIIIFVVGVRRRIYVVSMASCSTDTAPITCLA